MLWHMMPTGPHPIDLCLGQPDCSRVVNGQPSASAFVTDSPSLGGGGGTLLAPDGNRLLVYEGEPAYHFQPAARVIGQAGFSTDEPVDYRGISATTLAAPADVAVQGGTLAVADRGNNRVLLYRTSDVGSPGAAAQLVLGQPDMLSYLPNVDQRTPSAATMSGPGGVALDGTHLIVADTENHRVLIWSTLPTTNGQPADIILGQSDGSGNRPNRGRGDSNPADGFSDADADGFFQPTGVASDGTHLYVSDRVNHRVLVWSTFPTGNAQPADQVLGQPSMTANQPNRGQGAYALAPDGFDLPTGLRLDGASLWVADTESNRVVRWDQVATAPTPGAFLGQPDGSTLGNPNAAPPPSGIEGSIVAEPTSATSALRPRAVAVAGGRIYVAETDSNRVHVFDGASLAPLGELGQASDTTATANTGGIGASGLWGPLGVASDGARLYAADARNHRVVGWDVTSPPTTDAPASVVVGQPGFLVGGFNQASSAADGVTLQPSGLARAGNLLYVADSGHNRVLAFAAPPQSGAAPARVFGQPDGSLSLANSGGAPSARTLDEPRAVYADAQRLIVADSGNHRVLVYDATAPTNDATLVLGQPDFGSNRPNQGGAAGLETLTSPEGVYSDGTQLWIA
ncbi:MAG TPA: NHL repeat-containing protein, partial [Polyangia bacterium]|nr:NHL repeat-containing protein [Polyangia bacterium]